MNSYVVGKLARFSFQLFHRIGLSGAGDATYASTPIDFKGYFYKQTSFVTNSRGERVQTGSRIYLYDPTIIQQLQEEDKVVSLFGEPDTYISALNVFMKDGIIHNCVVYLQ